MYEYFNFFLGTYFLETLAIMGAFKLTHYCLDTHVNSFKQINPTHKKWYVVSNIIKSTALAIETPFCISVVKNALTNDIWEHENLLHLGCIYAGLDLVSIFMVPKLAKNTLYHHLIVNFLFIYTLTNGMAYNSFSRLIAIYAIFSCLAFPVNLFLGTRIICDNPTFLTGFSSFCLVNYVTCCLFNWSYQVYNLMWTPFFYQTYGILPVISFCGFIAIVMWDDLILMKYLRDNSIFVNWMTTKKTLLEFSNNIQKISNK